MSNSPEILTINEIESRYIEQWVVVEETDWDVQGQPIKGIVLGHNVNEDALTPLIQQLHRQKPDIQTFTFYTGSIVPEGIVVLV